MSETYEVLPCIYMAHGGGQYAGTPMVELPDIEHLLEANHVAIVNYDYTLSKVAPYPAQLNDAYAGLKYIYAHADELRIDKNKIILHGESGGGGVASCLCLYAKDKGEVPVLGEVLVYPQLDYRWGSDKSPYHTEYTGEFIVNAPTGKLCWDWLLGNQDIPADEMRYVSPAVATIDQLKGLPPTYIIVGSIDGLVHEAIDYAGKLVQAGVLTELFVEPGVPHAYDMLGEDTQQKKRFNGLRDQFIQTLLNK